MPPSLVFHPMAEPALLVGCAIAALALVFVRIIRATSLGGLASWIGRALAVILMLTILIRPGLTEDNQTVQASQVDVFLMVDTTASVAAEDGAEGTETRLSAIRRDVGALVDELAGARFELITFDRTAVLRVPLTSDSASILTAVEILRPEVSVQATGSSIGMPGRLLLDQLRLAADRSPQRARAAYYFGDGEQTTSTTPESFAASAPYLGGGRVLGYGTADGGAMKANEGRATEATDYIVDPRTGSPAISRLDAAALGTIAAELGVPFEQRDDSSPAAPGAIRGSTLTSEKELSRSSVTELYWIPVLPLFGLLIVEFNLILRALFISGRGRRLS